MLSSRPERSEVEGPASRTRAQWFRALWPGALAVLLVAIESNDFFSATHTGGFLYPLFLKYFGYISPDNWALLHHEIRKAGHLTGFGIVGNLFYLTMVRSLPQRAGEARQRYQRRCGWWAVLASMLLASADEIHQTFIPSRTGRWQDVVIDTCGAWLGLMVRFGLLVWFGSKSPPNLTKNECK